MQLHNIRLFFTEENAFLVAFFIYFLIGVGFGFLWARLGYQNSDLGSYLSEYFRLAACGGLRFTFSSVIWDIFKWPFAILLFGCTLLGSVIIPLLVFLRGFLLSYASACLIIFFGYDGFAVALTLFFITVVLELPVFFVFADEFLRSNGKICFKSGSRDSVNFHFGLLLTGVGVLIIASIFQWIAVPGLFTAVCARLFT